jgi:NTP pyrophosphatase (non-canonical NTP hydrolase)
MATADRPIARRSLDVVQVEHRYWIEHNFPGETKHQAFLGMAEELGEISHHLLKREQSIRSEGVDHAAEIRDGCADLIIFMMTLADNEGFLLLEAVNEAWEEVKQRDWIKYPHDGRTR